MENILGIPFFKALLTVFTATLFIREYVTYQNNLFLKYLFTPLVTVSVIAFTILAFLAGNRGSYELLILLGLVLSLVADTLLMIKETDLFKHGLIFFLFAHISYVTAFSRNYSFEKMDILIIIFVLAVFFPIYRILKDRVQDLFIPVMIYMGAMACMVYFALSGLNRGITLRHIFAASGAVLFLMSDVILSIDTFVKKINHQSVIVWALYAPGQLLLALSCF